MKKLTLTAASLIIASFAFAGPQSDAGQAEVGAEPVSASFARLFAHEPYYGPSATFGQTGDDPLTQRVYAILRDGPATPVVADASVDSVTEAKYWINVVESFRHMLDHQPYAGTTSGAAHAAADPMKVAFYAMLRGGGEVAQVAASRSSTRIE